MEVGGSLGGVQVVSLCEGKGVHTRIVSAGRAATHAHALPHDDDKALLFTITRNVEALDDADAPGNFGSCFSLTVRVTTQTALKCIDK